MAFTSSQLPRLDGSNAIVTGANSGIGFHAALELARHGAAVTLACRRGEPAQQAVDKIRSAVPSASLRIASLDLASLDSVRAFAASWHEPLHVLVNNAGVMAPPRWRATQDGNELQFGTNHLGHFALTGRLLPWLVAGGGRVATVSSIAHRSGDAGVLFGNPEHGYNPMQAYSNSKLANLLFALELQRRAKGLTSAAAHPGLSATNLFKARDGIGANPILRLAGSTFGRLVLQSSKAGAWPTLFAATVAEPGSYSGPRWFGEARGPAVGATVSAAGRDADLAAQLWDLSEELTDVRFEWPAGGEVVE